MCPIYTKTFGGKIWNNLHSVSPDNFFGKNFKGVTPWIIPAKNITTYLLEHKLTRNNSRNRSCFSKTYEFVFKMVYSMMTFC